MNVSRSLAQPRARARFRVPVELYCIFNFILGGRHGRGSAGEGGTLLFGVNYPTNEICPPERCLPSSTPGIL